MFATAPDAEMILALTFASANGMHMYVVGVVVPSPWARSPGLSSVSLSSSSSSSSSTLSCPNGTHMYVVGLLFHLLGQGVLVIHLHLHHQHHHQHTTAIIE